MQVISPQDIARKMSKDHMHTTLDALILYIPFLTPKCEITGKSKFKKFCVRLSF